MKTPCFFVPHNAVVCFLVLNALACNSDVLAQSSSDAVEVTVDVRASPLRSSPLSDSPSVSILKGLSLERSRATTLGATLDQQLPGIQNNGFGIGAGRPVIRGQDGPRVKITNNGTDTLDVSALSPDHAVTVNPLTSQSIEVLRGPATLAYGSGAIGGLVNVVSDAIPRASLKGTKASFLLDNTFNGGNAGSNQAFSASTGQRGLNFTLSGFKQRFGDYKTPLGSQVNSYKDADGASIGSSFSGQRGYIGLALSTNSSQYGAPTEPDVYLDLKQQRIDAAGELIDPIAGFERVTFKWGQSKYRHNEIDRPTGDIGTAIAQRGHDGRIELAHMPLAGIRGVFGIHSLRKDLTVSGAEAYLPNTKSSNTGLFYLAEKSFGSIKTEFGARHETASLSPVTTSGFVDRKFSLNSTSAGVSFPLLNNIALLGSLSRAERAPVAEELYALGPHAATGTFETGDPSLKKERSTNIDLGLKYQGQTLSLKASTYLNRYSNYIFGQRVDSDGDGIADRTDSQGVVQNSATNPSAGDFNAIAYAQSKATFKGIELEANWRPNQQSWWFTGFFDIARGRLNTPSGSINAPRMAPSRIGFSANYAQGSVTGYLAFTRASQVSRLAQQETATSGYTRVDAELAYRFTSGSNSAQVFLQGRNLLNETIRLHTSYIKDTVPMPGRAVVIGVRGQL